MDLAIMYHYVMNKDEFKGSVPINPDDFRNQINYGNQKYTVVGPTEAKKVSGNKFLITFDDATRDQYTTAYKILKEENLKGYFAIMSGPLVNRVIPIFHLVHIILSKVDDKILWDEISGKFNLPENIHELSSVYSYEQNIFRRYNKYTFNYLLDETICREYLEGKVKSFYGSLDTFIDTFYIRPNEILEMNRNGMEIGVHCVNHRPYSGDAQKFYNDEIQPCKEYLTKLLGKEPKWYTPAFGGGENTDLMLKELTPILKQNGFTGGFTTIEGYCEMQSDDFWHNRVDCNKLEQFLRKDNVLI